MIRRWRIDVKAEVTSSNTVGYKKLTNLDAGFNWVAPMFLTVGTEGVNVQDIILEFKEGEDPYGGCSSIQILDPDGNPEATYYWHPVDDIDDGTPEGWYDGATFVTTPLSKGLSVIVEDVDGIIAAVKMLGEVADAAVHGDYETTSVTGFNWVGNTTPDYISPQEITIELPDGEDPYGGCADIQILDPDGNPVTTYYWHPADDIDDGTPEGWYDGATFVTDPIAPGQGFIVETPDFGDVTITIPAAL